jgi:acyl-CoA synthetase (AMP-forming)/AMP-acid ligase II
MSDSNIANTLEQVGEKFTEHLGLVVPDGASDRRWTFGELCRITNVFAKYLAVRGIKRGDKIILMVKPSAEFICLTFALFKLQAVVVLIDPGMGYRNLLSCIGQVKPVGFIGIVKAHLLKLLFPKPFQTVTTSICIGFSGGLFGKNLNAHSVSAQSSSTAENFVSVGETDASDPAAILFTTGSTGPPKGVCYTHGIFQAQLNLIRDFYGITHADIDQPAFPLFGLFSAALGACAVIPDMNPSKPAQVNPQRFVDSILKYRVTYSFGSPAIWRAVTAYCLNNHIILPTLKKILMAGAPVPGDLIERTRAILEPDAEIYTPYGATECLPVSSISSSEILAETWSMTRQGKGTCVGKPLPGNEVQIIPPQDKVIAQWRKEDILELCEIGEIVVKGPVVTERYENNEQETAFAKIRDGDNLWHRMGDVGYLDVQNRLWFCGRKAHMVVSADRIYYTICCEAITNEHPDVYRSALVGIGEQGNQIPVMIVEPNKKRTNTKIFLAEVQKLAEQHELTKSIVHFLVHPSFPVDIRHNAKIFREKLAIWAAEQVAGGRAR